MFVCTLLQLLCHFRRYDLPSTREMAYVSSITAAGITYAVARACARGNILLLDCKCLKQNDAASGLYFRKFIHKML